MKRYNPSDIEPKWQNIWAQDKRYEAVDFDERQKFYISCMFPYPSGIGMHVGHAFEHVIVDSIARFQRAHDKNVMNPMGWDSFGLPAENYAIKTGTPPAVATKQNISNFIAQLKRLGLSIDWSRELNTSDPEYYRWTQWIFTKFYERGLAYQKESLQWWCPVDKTVLANEQVEAGKCWRCGTTVEKKSMKQWFFKITDYADALLEEIDDLDWPQKIKTAQANWIGKSQGAEITFTIDNHDDVVTVFSTRADTIFGATFLVLAPEHDLIKQLTTDDMRESVDSYVAAAVKKTEIERQSEGKDKTGVWTGSYATNPANGEKVPIWVADYVLGGYGTGAIMGVPAHDERDFAFAERFDLPIVEVVAERMIAKAKSAPRENVETLRRHVVDAIIIRPDGKYLLMDEGVGSKYFVGGGVEDVETVEVAIRREVIEETGYINIASVREVSNTIWFSGYRIPKQKNQVSHGKFYEVLLADEEQVRSEVDDGKHTIEWVTQQELESLLNWEHHQRGYEQYKNGVQLFHGEGTLMNSGVFNDMESSEAREQIVAWLEQQGQGKAKTTYKMRDWLISRQRYWGAPIPIIHCDEHGAVAVPAKDLPVILPEIADYAPRGDGKTALESATDWVNTTCPTCGKPAKRETDTMDGYACSSWYLLRYTDPQNAEQAWNPNLANYWAPVDMYVGGDHAVAHLLYVRFWTHVFHDMKLLDFKEPVKKLVYHGLIGAEDGRKMSKSLGNTVDPIDIVKQGYGVDSLRVFELFLGPINENSSWNSRGIAGVYRFLNRVWTLMQEYDDAEKQPRESDAKLQSLQQQTIKKVTDDFHRLSFNTAIAALMEYVNELYKLKTNGFSDEWKPALEALVQLVAPIAPHMAAELWQQLGNGDNLDRAAWPVVDESKIQSGELTIIVQVNGKVRAKLSIVPDMSEDDIKAAALADSNVQKFLENKKPTKVIYIPGRLLSIVS